MLRFDLNDLRIFLALTRTLNIGQAADFIGLTPSAVSLRLKKLEEALGVQLFLREPRGLILTEAGTTLLGDAQTLSEQAAALTAHMAAYAEDETRELVVASNTSGLQNYLAPYISHFLAAHPGRCRFVECASSFAADAVREGSADVGFGLVSPKLIKDRSLKVIEVAHDHHVLITPKAHPLAAAGTVSYAETLKYPQITPSHQSPMAAAMKERAAALGVTLLPMLQLPSFELIIRVVSEGTGIAVVPESALAGHQEVAVVKLSDLWAIRPMGFYLPAQRPSVPRANHFVDGFVELKHLGHNRHA